MHSEASLASGRPVSSGVGIRTHISPLKPVILSLGAKQPIMTKGPTTLDPFVEKDCGPRHTTYPCLVGGPCCRICGETGEVGRWSRNIKAAQIGVDAFSSARW